MQLVDNNKMELASYNILGFFDRLSGSSGMLAISPAGISIIDEIVVMFLFVEAKRRARNSASASSGFAAASASASAAATASSAAAAGTGI